MAAEPATRDEPAGATPDADPGRPSIAGLILLALLAALWSWWALEDGAYFGVVLLPGTIVACLCLCLVLGLAPTRIELRRSIPVVVALASLLLLGAWAALSAVWSPVPEVAIADGQRIALYAIVFGLGIWLSALVAPRWNLTLAPLAIAAGVAGVVTLLELLNGAPRDLLGLDGTLDYPLGYRNATAAFFAIAIFPAIGLASDGELDWRLRGLATATATLCFDFVGLCQSRASVGALAIALVIYVLVSPTRLRTLSWLVLAAIPAVAIVAPASDLYAAASDGLRGTADEMHAGGRVAALTTIAALVLGLLAARFEARLPGLRSGSRPNRAVGRLIAAGLVLAVIGFVVSVGSPVSWFEDRLDEFNSNTRTDTSGSVGRLSVDAGSSRKEIWRVALSDAGDDPLLGDGGGGFQYSFLRKRGMRTTDVRDAHSVELELLSELGVPGLALLLAALGGATIAIVGVRRRFGAAAPLAATVLGAGTYWLIHSSVDWFWPYPAVTAPVIALLGSACAPTLIAAGRHATLPRLALTLGAVVLALSAVPPFLSARYVDDAFDSYRDEIDRAYEDLDRAADLNPLSATPQLSAGVIAREVGDRARAIEAIEEAVERRPEEWAAHDLLAELRRDTNPAAARRSIRTALELNPFGDRIAALAGRLGIKPPDPG